MLNTIAVWVGFVLQSWCPVAPASLGTANPIITTAVTGSIIGCQYAKNHPEDYPEDESVSDTEGSILRIVQRIVMNLGEIDRFPVGQLQSRYALARSAVYKRMEQLGISPERIGQKAFINDQQLRLMDDLHNFINQGGSAPEFIEARGLRQKPGFGDSGRNDTGAALAPMVNDFGGLISAIVSEVVGRIGFNQPDPLQYFETLESAARNGWLLSTQELAELIDLSPQEVERYGDRFFEAGFIFSRSGYRKNGEIAWKVTKRLK